MEKWVLKKSKKKKKEKKRKHICLHNIMTMYKLMKFHCGANARYFQYCIWSKHILITKRSEIDMTFENSIKIKGLFTASFWGSCAGSWEIKIVDGFSTTPKNLPKPVIWNITLAASFLGAGVPQTTDTDTNGMWSMATKKYCTKITSQICFNKWNKQLLARSSWTGGNVSFAAKSSARPLAYVYARCQACTKAIKYFVL